jgi:hypothetical protein
VIIGTSIFVAKAYGRHVFGSKPDREIHDGLLLSIMEILHEVVVQLDEVLSPHVGGSLGIEPSSSNMANFDNLQPIIGHRFMVSMKILNSG